MPTAHKRSASPISLPTALTVSEHPLQTTTRIKDTVTPKIGSSWSATIHAERANSTSQSAMYGGSCREPSFEELVEMRSRKG
jgi:hypothetical protein